MISLPSKQVPGERPPVVKNHSFIRATLAEAKEWNTVHPANEGVCDGYNVFLKDSNRPWPKDSAFRDPSLSTIADVHKRIENGWEDGVALVADISANVASTVPTVDSILSEWHTGDRGSLLWEPALAGDWDQAYRRLTVKPVRDKVVVLYVQLGGSAFLTREKMRWTGAQGLAAAMILEKAGYEVEINALYCSIFGFEKNLSKQTIVLRLKDAGEALRPDILAATLCDPTFFRTVGFQGIVQHDQYVSSGLGCPDLKSADANVKTWQDEGYLPPGGIVMPSVYSNEGCAHNVGVAVEVAGEFLRPEDAKYWKGERGGE